MTAAMKVRVFKNLNKGCLSILATSGEYRGKVIAYANAVLIRQCEFIVSEKSRQRAVKEGVRNVHAFCQGELVDLDLIETRYPVEMPETPWVGGHEDLTPRRVRYNPFYKATFFDAATEEPIYRSNLALIDRSGARVEEQTMETQPRPLGETPVQDSGAWCMQLL